MAELAEKYLWVDQIATKWGVSKSWVYRLCRQGRVTGAFFRDGRWSVPENAVKPKPQPSQRIKRLQSKRTALPMRFPLRFTGDSENVPLTTERLFEGCAEYVMDFVDLAPGNGSTLFCALSYPHIKAMAFCGSAAEYAFLSSLKEMPQELYSKLSMMLFEFYACQPSERKEYYRNIRDGIPALVRKYDMLSLAAGVLFLCQTSSGGEIGFSGDGFPVCEMKRRPGTDEPLLSDFMCLSELLSRAKIYPNCELLADTSAIPEYSAVHISEFQYENDEFSHITRVCERVLVI